MHLSGLAALDSEVHSERTLGPRNPVSMQEICVCHVYSWSYLVEGASSRRQAMGSIHSHCSRLDPVCNSGTPYFLRSRAWQDNYSK